MNEPKPPKLSPNMSESAIAHAKRYIETNGAEGHMWPVKDSPAPVPTLLLTTTGRKSGERFINPLIYVETLGKHVIIASRGGAPDNPGWYKNLVAHPEVEVQVKADKFRARARTTSGAERAALWKTITQLHPLYEGYQRRATSREIPVIVLEPIAK